MNASCSLFSQILKLTPCMDFEPIVKQTGAQCWRKGLSSWSQFVTMRFCQLEGAYSLEKIEGDLRSREGKIVHLGAVTWHLESDHDIYLPGFGLITDTPVHEVKVAHQLPFTPCPIVVDDRMYDERRLFAPWTKSKLFIITRLKDNAQFKVDAMWEPPDTRQVLKDQRTRLSGPGTEEKCPQLLHGIETVWAETGNSLLFLTSPIRLDASTVADINRDRWRIELIFKALKQNPKINPFDSTSANAVKTQIWAALIYILLLRYLQLSARFDRSLPNLTFIPLKPERIL